MDKFVSTLVFILMLVLCMAFFIATAGYVQAWVLVRLWSWFVVPTFEVSVINLPTAFGLAVIVSFLTHTVNAKEFIDPKYLRSSSEQLITYFSSMYIFPVVTYFVGYVVYTYWM